MFEHVLILGCAWIMDALIGDPERFPHPVRVIGAFIARLERWCRATWVHKKAAGVFIGVCVPGTVFVVAFSAVHAAGVLAPWLGYVLSTGIIYTCLSTRCLGHEALGVLRELRRDDLAASRRRLARIVGRDTAALSRGDIIRAAIESVSENTVDGIIAPLFYALIGGAPLALAYKAVNTLDSMIGYKNEAYRDLGWFSARLDDAANYLPARLCLVLVPAATLFFRPARTLTVLSIMLRDGRKSPSPNAGFPEAGFAGVLGIRLGGPCSYGGVATAKPVIGDHEREGTIEDIARAVRLMWVVSALSLAFLAGTGILVANCL